MSGGLSLPEQGDQPQAAHVSAGAKAGDLSNGRSLSGREEPDTVSPGPGMGIGWEGRELMHDSED